MFAAYVLTITDGQDTQGTGSARACRRNCRPRTAQRSRGRVPGGGRDRSLHPGM